MTGTAMTEAAGVRQDLQPRRRLDSHEYEDRARRHGRRGLSHFQRKWKAIVDEIEQIHEKGQPLLIGTTSIEKSELLSGMLNRRGIPHQVLNAKYHEKEAAIVKNAGDRGAVTVATNMAGRGTDIKLGEGVVGLGGLYVLGTERHEARRIDNQLRGRSGRQGIQASRAFTWRWTTTSCGFSTARVGLGFMEKLGMTEGQAIESRMVTNAIKNAQKKSSSATSRRARISSSTTR